MTMTTPRKTFVRYQDIGTAADQVERNICLPQECGDLFQFQRRRGDQQTVHLAANAGSGVIRHEDIFLQTFAKMVAQDGEGDGRIAISHDFRSFPEGRPEPFG
ncbi:MAG: hypothetical protein AB9891_17000 [Anaerolineaceae bacterium]